MNCWSPETTKKPTASEPLSVCGGTVVEPLPMKVDKEEQGVPKTESEEGMECRCVAVVVRRWGGGGDDGDCVCRRPWVREGGEKGRKCVDEGRRREKEKCVG